MLKVLHILIWAGFLNGFSTMENSNNTSLIASATSNNEIRSDIIVSQSETENETINEIYKKYEKHFEDNTYYILIDTKLTGSSNNKIIPKEIKVIYNFIVKKTTEKILSDDPKVKVLKFPEESLIEFIRISLENFDNNEVEQIINCIQTYTKKKSFIKIFQIH